MVFREGRHSIRWYFRLFPTDGAFDDPGVCPSHSFQTSTAHVVCTTRKTFGFLELFKANRTSDFFTDFGNNASPGRHFGDSWNWASYWRSERSWVWHSPQSSQAKGSDLKGGFQNFCVPFVWSSFFPFFFECVTSSNRFSISSFLFFLLIRSISHQPQVTFSPPQALPSSVTKPLVITSQKWKVLTWLLRLHLCFVDLNANGIPGKRPWIQSNAATIVSTYYAKVKGAVWGKQSEFKFASIDWSSHVSSIRSSCATLNAWCVNAQVYIWLYKGSQQHLAICRATLTCNRSICCVSKRWWR